MKKNKSFRGFIVSIVIPTLLTILLFVILFYVFIVPEFENNMLNRKREMIKELTNSAWSVLAKHAQESNDSLISIEEAKSASISVIKQMRYGEEEKDYFWITDMEPKMIVHPYRDDLNGSNLSDFTDRNGKKLFVDFVKIIKKGENGYSEYMWQWKDDSLKIVPKLSYVKCFEPWGWIIGTGVYIEDVKHEIAVLERRLLRMTLVITIGISILLLIIIIQSLRTEKKRQKAESELRITKDKYQTLVDAATEGTLMIMNGGIIFSNQIIQRLLGYNHKELSELNFSNLLSDDAKWKVEELVNQEKHQIKLRKIDKSFIDVEILISCMEYDNKKAYVLKIWKIRGERLVLENDKNKFKNLTDNIKIGVFRTTLGTRGHIIETNPAVLEILGFENETDLFKANIFALFHEKEDRKNFLRELLKKGSLKNHIIRMNKGDGTVTTIAVSAVIVLNEEGDPLYCDGIVEDISEQKSKEEQREKLITELQTLSLLLNQPLKHYTKELLSCEIDESIIEAGKLMTKNNYNAILVKTKEGDTVGIVTDKDIRERVVVAGKSSTDSISAVMSSPLISISNKALLYEAISLMQEKDLSHLGVKDNEDKIVSIVNKEELLQVYQYSISLMKKRIENTDDIEVIAEVQNRLPLLLSSLVNSGANVKSISRITTVIYDTITTKLIQLAIAKIGVPPVEFSFVTIGSAGREEQTLATDQDTIIVYNDVSVEEEDGVNAYFLSLGEMVSEYLNKVGYKFCPGDIMARNPKWCKSISEWKEYFTKWISSSSPQDLLEVNIFFDMKESYGNGDIITELNNHIEELVAKHPGFFLHLSNNVLLYKPPLGLMGNIVVGSNKDYPDSFDIKHAMTTIVNIARIYSLKYTIHETNTFSRLIRLKENGVFTDEAFREREEAYRSLMQLRIKHQINHINEGKEPDNFINPKRLTNIEQAMIRKIFTQINGFLSILSYDFKGRS